MKTLHCMGKVVNKALVIGLIIISVPGCFRKTIIQLKPQPVSEHVTKEILPTAGKPITILVHGTRMPPPLMVAVPGLVRQIITPAGLHRASDLDFTYLFARIAHTLDEVDHGSFPLENTYLFGWSGALSFKARKKAAERLYGYIRQLRHDLRYKDTPITVITVSHGGNVGLNLGKVAEERGDKDLVIDRLILLCSPIQDATERYANSPIFKKVYHLYSSGEMVQIADPQGMYDKSEMGCKPEKLFSHRLIKDAGAHIVQAEIRYKKRTLCHIDFAMPHFTKRLPKVLAFLEDENSRRQLPQNNDGAFVFDLKRLSPNKLAKKHDEIL